MEFPLPILIVISIIYLIVLYVVKQYEVRKHKIQEHVDAGSIVPSATPDAMSRNALRHYSIRYTKDGKEETATLAAQNYFDAKYQAMVNLNIDLKSILSVV